MFFHNKKIWRRRYKKYKLNSILTIICLLLPSILTTKTLKPKTLNLKPKMNWIDIIVLIPLCWYAFRGFKNGFLMEIISLAALFLGLFCFLQILRLDLALAHGHHVGEAHLILSLFRADHCAGQPVGTDSETGAQAGAVGIPRQRSRCAVWHFEGGFGDWRVVLFHRHC